MLGSAKVHAVVAVKDLETAKAFYIETLGLTKGEVEVPGGLVLQSGDSQLLIYESEFAGTNKATAASWMVGNVDEVATQLASGGVSFEHYEFPNTTLEGDVHVMGKMRAAWFKDPDGNILCAANGEGI